MERVGKQIGCFAILPLSRIGSELVRRRMRRQRVVWSWWWLTCRLVDTQASPTAACERRVRWPCTGRSWLRRRRRTTASCSYPQSAWSTGRRHSATDPTWAWWSRRWSGTERADRRARSWSRQWLAWSSFANSSPHASWSLRPPSTSRHHRATDGLAPSGCAEPPPGHTASQWPLTRCRPTRRCSCRVTATWRQPGRHCLVTVCSADQLLSTSANTSTFKLFPVLLLIVLPLSACLSARLPGKLSTNSENFRMICRSGSDQLSIKFWCWFGSQFLMWR